MKNVLTIFGCLVAFVVAWHIKVASSSETKITGFFTVQPAQPGYVWDAPDLTDSNLMMAVDEAGEPAPPEAIMTQPRFFWQKNHTVWRPGMRNPAFNVVASADKDRWKPLAGYVWENDINEDLTTKWKAGLRHPHYKVFSAEQEGRWQPALGYTFDDETQASLSVHWVTGQQYPDHKIISAETPDTFKAFAGYQFTDPEKSLQVAWTPGLPNPTNVNEVSGTEEGTWVALNEPAPILPVEETPSTHLGNAVALGGLGGTIEYFFGPNMVSEYFYGEAKSQVGKAIVKKLSE